MIRATSFLCYLKSDVTNRMKLLYIITSEFILYFSFSYIFDIQKRQEKNLFQ